MKNNNIRYEIRIIGVTKQYNLVFPIKFKNMMHKEFESSVYMCREDIRPVRSEILERFLPLYSYSMTLPLPKGSAKKLIGRELKWEDEPVELKILDYDS